MSTARTGVPYCLMSLQLETIVFQSDSGRENVALKLKVVSSGAGQMA